ncbi:hypothetical protein EJB05_53168, partial [Eragrostis curvula]
MTDGTPASRDQVSAEGSPAADKPSKATDSPAAGDPAAMEGDPDRSYASGDPEQKEKEEGSEESEEEEGDDGVVLEEEEDEQHVQEDQDEVDDKQKAIDPPQGVPSCEYSWGIHDGTLLWMFILIVLLNLFMLILPLPGLRTDDPVTGKFWKISLLLCTHLFVMTIPTTRKAAGVPSLLTSISYGPLLAFAAFDLIGPHAGITIVHLSTAWAAGTFGHSLAQYRLHEGTEDAATVVVARTPTGQSKKQRWQHLETKVYCVVTSSFLTLCFAGRVLWLLFVPSYEDNICLLVVELSVLVWITLYFWLLILSPLMLHGALIPADSMLRLYAYFIVLCAVSVVCYLISRVLWAYFFGLEMMIMAAVVGYSLAVSNTIRGCCNRKYDVITSLFVLEEREWGWWQREGPGQSPSPCPAQHLPPHNPYVLDIASTTPIPIA